MLTVFGCSRSLFLLEGTEIFAGYTGTSAQSTLDLCKFNYGTKVLFVEYISPRHWNNISSLRVLEFYTLTIAIIRLVQLLSGHGRVAKIRVDCTTHEQLGSLQQGCNTNSVRQGKPLSPQSLIEFSLSLPFFHHWPQRVLLYRNVGPTGEVRGFKWFQPLRTLKHPTFSGLFIKKVALNQPALAWPNLWVTTVSVLSRHGHSKL